MDRVENTGSLFALLLPVQMASLFVDGRKRHGIA